MMKKSIRETLINFVVLNIPMFLVTTFNRIIDKRRKLNIKKDLLESSSNELLDECLSTYELLKLVQKEIQVPVVYDIGAHTGTWTLLATNIFPNSPIVCFEPILDNYNILKEKFSNNNLVRCFNLAVGAQTESIEINKNSYVDTSSILELSDYTVKKYNVSTLIKQKITIVSLDEIIENEKLKPPDLIKLDIQGYELEALKGCSNILQNTCYILCEVSFIEFYQKQAYFSDIVSFLRNINFELFSISKSTLLGVPLDQTDVLFRKKNGRNNSPK